MLNLKEKSSEKIRIHNSLSAGELMVLQPTMGGDDLEEPDIRSSAKDLVDDTTNNRFKGNSVSTHSRMAMHMFSLAKP